MRPWHWLAASGSIVCLPLSGSRKWGTQFQLFCALPLVCACRLARVWMFQCMTSHGMHAVKRHAG